MVEIFVFDSADLILTMADGRWYLGERLDPLEKRV